MILMIISDVNYVKRVLLETTQMESIYVLNNVVIIWQVFKDLSII